MATGAGSGTQRSSNPPEPKQPPEPQRARAGVAPCVMTGSAARSYRCHTYPVLPDHERERLSQTFDRAAESYDRIRPDYPEALFDDLTALAGLRPGDHLLEVGCGTGQATLPLARRGFRVTCVELGAGLADRPQEPGRVPGGGRRGAVRAMDAR